MLCVEICGVILVKVLILVGFNDIGCDIGICGDVLSIKHKKYRFFFVILRFFSWCVDKPTEPVVENS